MISMRAGDARLAIDLEAGARLASLEVAGLELLVARTASPLHWGSYPLAPWTGRLRRGRLAFEGGAWTLPVNFPPHAIHGTTFDRPWRREGEGRFAVSLGEAWPFPGRAVQEVDLGPERLRQRLEVHALERPFPACVGFHPWFRRRLARGLPVRLEFEAGARYATDAEGIPTGALEPPAPGPWDDCFTDVRRGPRLVWEGALSLALRTSANHWVVYDEPAHAVCVEPMTGPPDGPNLAPAIVAPGRPLAIELEMTWERPDRGLLPPACASPEGRERRGP